MQLIVIWKVICWVYTSFFHAINKKRFIFQNHCRTHNHIFCDAYLILVVVDTNANVMSAFINPYDKCASVTHSIRLPKLFLIRIHLSSAKRTTPFAIAIHILETLRFHASGWHSRSSFSLHHRENKIIARRRIVWLCAVANMQMELTEGITAFVFICGKDINSVQEQEGHNVWNMRDASCAKASCMSTMKLWISFRSLSGMMVEVLCFVVAGDNGNHHTLVAILANACYGNGLNCMTPTTTNNATTAGGVMLMVRGSSSRVWSHVRVCVRMHIMRLGGTGDGCVHCLNVVSHCG